MLQSVSEHKFNTISGHCIHHYVILLLIACDTLVHYIRKQITGTQGAALTGRGLSLCHCREGHLQGNRLDSQLLGMRFA